MISGAGLDIIKRFEGLRREAYLCPAKVWTIGYGSTRGVTRGMVVTEEEAESLLMADVKHAERSVAGLITRPLLQNQYDALVSFTFNLGGGALQRSTLRQKINRMEDADVPEEFSKWVWAGGRKLPGLMARRKAEADLYAALPWA